MILSLLVALLVAAEPGPIVVVAAVPRSRLAGEIARELLTSGFLVEPLPAGADWRREVLDVDAADPLVGVLVDDPRGRVLLFERSSGEVRTRLEIALGPDDRLFRRRTRLRVVEELRMLAPTQRPPVAPPIELVAAPPLPQLAREPIASRPWSLAVATTVNFDSGQAEPTSHVQWIWDVPLGEHLSAQARLLWPMVGSHLETEDLHARLWTFALGGGLAYWPLPPATRVRPYLAVTVGARLLLSESDWIFLRQSRVALTPSAELGGEVGLRCRVAPSLHAFAALQAGRDWALRSELLPFERAAASAQLASASLGMLFER